MRATSDFLAIDLGAASGRVILGAWNGTQIELSELHRFVHGPVAVLNQLHWDVIHLWNGIKHGLSKYAQEYRTVPTGIGVDAWGVDFALLDSLGHLLNTPCSYRDARTEGVPTDVFATISEEELFRETGVQCWRVNTLYQLVSLVRHKDPLLDAAATMLMIPDLFSYWLTGEKAIELTTASTSQMLLRGKMVWADDILTRLQIPLRILLPTVSPGTVLASLHRDIAIQTGISSRPPVLLVAAHDTASAVASIPEMTADSAFISSGTWSLVGVETVEPIVTQQAFQLGFSNEQGAGSVLLLRNVTGLWLLQECMRQWHLQGHSYSWEELLAMAERATPFVSLVEPDAAAFVAPSDMPFAIRNFCHRTGQPEPEGPAEVARCLMDSLSLRYLEVLEALEEVTNRKLSVIRIVGGGSRNRLLCQLTADATSRVVFAGPAEASAMGNVMMQAIGTRCIANASEGRAVIAASTERVVFEPRHCAATEDAYHRFLDLCKCVPA